MTGKVLVVEDDRAIALMLKDILQDEGFDVILAGDGAEALREVEQRLPSMIFLDLQLPTLNGQGVARELAQRHIDVPIVVMTAGAGAARWAETLHAAAYLSKPFGVDRVIELATKYAHH